MTDDFTELTMTEPTMTEPTMTKPTMTEPTMTKPTMTKPTMTKPTMTKPTMTKPTMMERLWLWLPDSRCWFSRCYRRCLEWKAEPSLPDSPTTPETFAPFDS